MKYISSLIILVLSLPVMARDIDLDKIYLNEGSTDYRKITSLKSSIFSRIRAQKLDKNVIFSRWISNDKIVYVKEKGDNNSIVIYDRKSGKKKILYRFTGSATFTDFNESSGILAIKFFNRKNLTGKILFYTTGTGRKITIPSNNISRNFVLLKNRPSAIIYRNGSFTELEIRTGKMKSVFSDLVQDTGYKNSLSLFPSPDNSSVLILSGGGGQYSGTLFTSQGKKMITGITSNSGLVWLNNSKFAYRSGSPGNYSVVVFDTKLMRKRILLQNTMNPDINFSEKAGILSFLRDQIVYLYNTKNQSLMNLSIEGEETYFSYNGRYFTTIYLGNLYLIRYSKFIRNPIILRRNACQLNRHYSETLTRGMSFTNSYSKNYLKRKRRIYKNICSGTGSKFLEK